MSVRQLVFLAVVGIVSLIAAVVTGPRVTDALLGETPSGAEPPAAEVPGEGPSPHPEAQP